MPAVAAAVGPDWVREQWLPGFTVSQCDEVAGCTHFFVLRRNACVSAGSVDSLSCDMVLFL